ncbi:MAG TPA: hypothetical protein VEO54_00390 [Thermoanaerobaculia bacterium]|nr:hypothetical protein [Thermoanaerobaculia bacterium]
MRRQHFGAAIVFAILSIAFTWPLAPNLDRAVADPGDPLINIWILDWDWWATLHQPLSLFHANVFHPARYTLALSENLYGVAVLLFPLRALGVGPVAAYNAAMLAGFAFCGFAAYLLGFRLTRSFAAGMAAGVFYAFVPFRFVHLSHVQHVWGGWLPLLLVALLAYHERPSWKRGWLLAAVFVMNGLTNIHYLLFGALALAVTAALLIPRAHWRPLMVTMFVAVLALLPFLYPYTQVGMQRTAEEVLRYSAMPADWLPDVGRASARLSGGRAEARPTSSTDPERRLDPGLLAYLVCALALFVRSRARVGLGLLWIAIGFMGSLGLHFVFHEFLFGAVPGFRAIRAPSRWAVIAYIGMAILIALFTATLRRFGWLVPAAFAVALWSAPVRWFLLDPQTPPVYEWLAKQKVSAIVELPMDTLSSEYEYMLHATAHHQRMVNGVSGFSPPLRDELSRLQHTDAFLDKAPVELVIVHSDRYGGEPAVQMRDWVHRELERGRLRYVARFDAKTGADWVFSTRGGKGPRPHDLNVFLYGGPTCIQSVAGALLFPPGGHPYRGRAELYGWAFSPHGIARVDFWFENRRVRYPARLTPLNDRRCPGPPAVRFERVFPSRPGDVRETTDVQVEVTDRRGQTAVFESRWISWE